MPLPHLGSRRCLRLSTPPLPPLPLPQALGDQLCGDTAAGTAALLQALAAGGEEARHAVAALLSFTCLEGPGPLQAVFDALTSAPELQQPETALRWVLKLLMGAGAACGSARFDHSAGHRSRLSHLEPRCSACHPLPMPCRANWPSSPTPRWCSYIAAFVAAADDVGAGACVSLVVTDEAGAVLAAYAVHTSGPAGGALLSDPEAEGGGSGGSEEGRRSGNQLGWINSFHAAQRSGVGNRGTLPP